MKIIILTLSASLLEAVNWGNKIFLFMVKWQSVVFFYVRDMLQKALRIHFAIIKKELRRKKQQKLKEPPVMKTTSIVIVNNIVGGSKTKFISELPDKKEPEPVETIELPLQEPEKPEEMPYPQASEFEQQTDGLTPEEMRQEMDEAFFNDNYDPDLPEDRFSGASVEDMTQAYNILHQQVPLVNQKEDMVANVINCLSGTDMFKIFINTEESERLADEIMDRHLQKFSLDNLKGKPSKFTIGNFVE